MRQQVLTCSTCDDYQLVDGDDGFMVRCPDCLHRTSVKCPAHGRSLKDGKCPECAYEVQVVEEQWERERAARTVPAATPLPQLLTDVLAEAGC